MLDSTIHRIKVYPMYNAIGFPNTYPVDSAIQRLNNRGQEGSEVSANIKEAVSQLLEFVGLIFPITGIFFCEELDVRGVCF